VYSLPQVISKFGIIADLRKVNLIKNEMLAKQWFLINMVNFVLEIWQY